MTFGTVHFFLPPHSIAVCLLLTRRQVAGFLMPRVSSCNLTRRVWHVTVACLISGLSWCLLVPSPDHRLQSGRCHSEHKRGLPKYSAMAADRCGNERQPSLTGFFYLLDSVGVCNIDVHDEIVGLLVRGKMKLWRGRILKKQIKLW